MGKISNFQKNPRMTHEQQIISLRGYQQNDLKESYTQKPCHTSQGQVVLIPHLKLCCAATTKMYEHKQIVVLSYGFKKSI